MKKKFAFVMATAMLMTAFAACNNAAPATTDPTTKAPSAQTLVIGGSGPLTGDYATYGVSVKQGAQLAMKEINAAGGVNGVMFDVRMEDDQADPAMAVSAYSTLVDAGMKVSLGGVTSGACIAASEEAKKDGMLMLTPSGSQKECVQYDNAFRICFTDPDQGKYAAQFIFDNKVSEKVAIIYDKSNDYSAGITENFVAKAKEVGLEVATQQAFTSQSNTDFSVQLQAVKSSGADLVFLPIYAQEAAYILTQAQKMELEVTFFGCDGMDGILEKIGADNRAATEGVMLLTPFAADSDDETVAKFVAAYKESYNAVPDQFAADGYDAVYAVAEAMKQANVTDINAADFNGKMIGAMTQITVKGTTGTMTWSADGEPAKSATAVVITNGTYVAYGK